MRIATRHISAHYHLLRSLGLRGTGQMVTQIWPIWDTVMVGALYNRGRSFGSSVLANELGVDSRLNTAPPATELLALASEFSDEPELARHTKFGTWEFVWIAEREHPLPVRPLSDAEFSAFPTGTFDLLQLGMVTGAGAFNSDTKWLVVDDKTGPIEVAYEMSELLGYAPKDHHWVPETWRTTPVEPGFRVRYDTVTAADGLDVTLRSFTVRLNNRFSVYLPRLWFGEQYGAGELSVSIPQAEQPAPRADRSTP